MRRRLACLAACAALLALGAAAAHWALDFEAGAAWTGRNDVRIPGDAGTLLSFEDDLSSDAAGAWRFRLTRPLGERGHLSAMAAPLRIEARGRAPRAVRFDTETFAAGTPISGRYRFDSYRLTYRHDVWRGRRGHAGFGVTAKVRDAAIRVAGEGRAAEKANTGFVPLVNFDLLWRFAPRAAFVVAGDALAAPQGRAEDVLVAVRYQATPRAALKMGYRLLEGGADNAEVFTFALLHYAVAGIQIDF